MLMIMSVMPVILLMIVSTYQGFVISLPYCFLNSEVQGVVKNHWSRWRMVRTSLFPTRFYFDIQGTEKYNIAMC